MNGLRDKVAIVTGGNSGSGRATALALTREGVHVPIAARSPEKADESLRMIEDVGGKAVFIRTDLTVAAQVEKLVAETVETSGRLDFGVNVAGSPGPSLPRPSMEKTPGTR